MADLQADPDYRLEQAKAEIGLLEAEKAFRDKKAAGDLTQEDKQELRALRQEWRDHYRNPPQAGASPGTIKTKGKVG